MIVAPFCFGFIETKGCRNLDIRLHNKYNKYKNKKITQNKKSYEGDIL